MANNLSQEQMVQRMYAEMVGLDGKSGMVKAIEDGKQSRKMIYERIEKLEDNVMTKGECAKIRAENNSRRRSKWLVTKDIILIILGPAGGAGIIALIMELTKARGG